MILLINLINPALPTVIVYRGRQAYFGRRLGGAKSGGIAISEIGRLEQSKKIDFKKLKIIAALSGPASFSGIRSEMAVVNSLAAVFKKPVVMIGEEEITELKSAAVLIAKKKKLKAAVPVYSREPNITSPKK